MINDLAEIFPDVGSRVTESDLDPRVDWLLIRANLKNRMFMDAVGQALYAAKETGQILLEAKAVYQEVYGKRGSWVETLKRNFSGSLRTAYNHMKIAQNWEQVEAYLQRLQKSEGEELGVSQALNLIQGWEKGVAEDEEEESLRAEEAVQQVETAVEQDSMQLMSVEQPNQPVLPQPVATAVVLRTPRLSNPDPSNEMYTPLEWLQRIESFFGQIDLDPSADPGRRVPARQHYCEADDGLSLPWFGKVYCNPPYSPVGETSLLDWSRKVIAELERAEVEAILLLLPGYTAEAWWHMLMPALPLILQIRGRLTFAGQASAARFPSVLVYFGADKERFARCFGDLGSLLKVTGRDEFWDDKKGEIDD